MARRFKPPAAPEPPPHVPGTDSGQPPPTDDPAYGEWLERNHAYFRLDLASEDERRVIRALIGLNEQFPRFSTLLNLAAQSVFSQIRARVPDAPPEPERDDPRVGLAYALAQLDPALAAQVKALITSVLAR